MPARPPHRSAAGSAVARIAGSGPGAGGGHPPRRRPPDPERPRRPPPGAPAGTGSGHRRLAGGRSLVAGAARSPFRATMTGTAVSVTAVVLLLAIGVCLETARRALPRSLTTPLRLDGGSPGVEAAFPLPRRVVPRPPGSSSSSGDPVTCRSPQEQDDSVPAGGVDGAVLVQEGSSSDDYPAVLYRVDARGEPRAGRGRPVRARTGCAGRAPPSAVQG